MNSLKHPPLQSGKPRAASLAGKALSQLGKASVRTRNLLVKASNHPKVADTRETCSDLWSDLKKVKNHPKVLTWREHLSERKEQLLHQPQSAAVARIRETIHPPYLVLAAGCLLTVAMGMLGMQSLKHSQNLRTNQISREAGMQIRHLRLQHNSANLDAWRGEQEKLQRALKALEQEQNSGAFRRPRDNFYS